MPRCHGPLEDDEEIDVNKLRLPDPMKAGRMRDRIEGIRLMRARVGEHYSIMGWVEGPAAEAADIRGVGNFFMDLIEDADASGELMQLSLENAINFARAQVEAGADTIGIGEAIASQVSAEIYGNQILPHTKQLVQAILDAGAYVKMHICGNIEHLLDHLASLPLSAIDLDHMVSLELAREKLGPDIAICTNLDPTSAVQRSHPEAIREAVEACYRRLGNPCMVNAGCEIPASTPHENLKALCRPLRMSPS